MTVRPIPVIDIKEGIAVRGVAGERGLYRPVESRFTDSHEVVDVAEALRDHFQLSELYIADLDAILQDRPNYSLYAQLVARGFDLQIDAGLRTAKQGRRLREEGARFVIAGLETAPNPEFLAELCDATGADTVIFSLDLRDGKPMTDSSAWNDHPLDIADQAIAQGIRRMIVLDLASVGVSHGLSTLELCRAIRTRAPQVDLTTGGGVRSIDDLRAAQRLGLQGVLIASALHNGSICPDDLRKFRVSSAE